MLKILSLYMYFKLHVFDVYNQVINNLKFFLTIEDFHELKQIKNLYSSINEEEYLEIALKILNKLQFNRIRNIKIIILHSTSPTLDLKFNGVCLKQETLINKDYNRCYLTNEWIM